MKVKVSPVILGIVAVVVGLYVYKVWTTPTVNVVVKKEGFADQSAGSIIGMVFAGVMGVGILLAFFGGLSEVGSRN